MTMIQTGKVRYEVRLFGPHRGKTMLINSHRFIDGVAVIEGQPEALQFALVYFSRYQAYAKGSQEYDTALTHEEAEHGDIAPPETSSKPEQTEGVRGDHEPPSSGTPEVQPPVSERDAGPPAGREGLRPEGDGYEDPGLHGSAQVPEVDESLRAAVCSLDPGVSAHWTQLGFPAVSAVAAAAKREDVTRADINVAVPDWNREKAQELAAMAS